MYQLEFGILHSKFHSKILLTLTHKQLQNYLLYISLYFKQGLRHQKRTNIKYKTLESSVRFSDHSPVLAEYLVHYVLQEQFLHFELTVIYCSFSHLLIAKKKLWGRKQTIQHHTLVDIAIYNSVYIYITSLLRKTMF